MYIYVIDTIVLKKKSEIVSQIKNTSRRFGIDGCFIYISALHDLKKEISVNLNDQSNTIIVVGNYGSLNKVVDAVFQLEKIDNTVFGIIPVELDTISQMLGMTGNIDKDILCVSQRLNRKFDVCVINNKYFLDSVFFSFEYGFNIEIDASYFIDFKDSCELVVGNIFFDPNFGDICKPFDGFFDVLLLSRNKKQKSLVGRFKGEKLNINTNTKTSIKYSLNGIQYKANNIQIDVIPTKVKMIVGKNSVFSSLTNV